MRIAAALFLGATLFLILPLREGGAADPAVEKLWKSGERALEAGEIDAALRNFEKALELDRNQPRTWNYLGGIRFHRQDYFRALLDFKQAFTLDPWDAKACNNVATAYDRLGQYDKAEQFYLRALEIDESYGVPHRNLGILYSRHLDRPDLARKHWERYLASSPRGPDADAVREELRRLEEGSAAPSP